MQRLLKICRAIFDKLSSIPQLSFHIKHYLEYTQKNTLNLKLKYIRNVPKTSTISNQRIKQ